MESAVLSMQEMVQEKSRIAGEELKLKMEKKGIEEEQHAAKHEKLGRKIQKKKLRNKKKRVTLDI